MASLVWQEIQPTGSAFAFAQGQRYAILASVSRGQSLAAIESYLTSHGWTVTYAWEQGTPTRGQYAIDAWLASLTPDPNTSHRWVYGEADRTGATTTIGKNAPWPLTVYEIAHVFEAVPAPMEPSGPAPPPPALPSATPPTPAPASSPAAAIALGVGIVGGLGLALRYALRFV